MELHQHRGETCGKQWSLGRRQQEHMLHCFKKEQKLKEKGKDRNYRNHKIFAVIENYIK